MKVCDCETGPANSGTPTCFEKAKDAVKFIFQRTYKDDGTRNGILLSATINQAYLDDRVNDPDPSSRWYPCDLLKNYDNVKGENVYETFSDNTKSLIEEGIRTLTANIVKNAGPRMLGSLKTYQCVDMSVYFIDKNGNIQVESVSEDGLTAYPTRIDKETFAPSLQKATPTTVEKILLTFDLDKAVFDEDAQMILASEYTGDIFGLKGLLDVVPTLGAITTTSIVLTLNTLFGSAKNKQPVTGLLAADFTLYNVTDAAPVVVVTAPENPDGTYTITFAAQTSGDDIRITPAKDGYDFTLVVAEIAEIP